MARRVLTRDRLHQPIGIPQLRGDSLARDLVVAYLPGSDINLARGNLMQRQSVTTETAAAGLVGRTFGIGSDGIDTGVSISGAHGLTVLMIVARMADTATSGNPATVQSVAHSSSAATLNRWELVLGNGFEAFADRNKPRFTQGNGGFGATNLQLRIDGNLQSSANPADVSLENGRFYTVMASGDAMEGDSPIYLFGRVFTDQFAANARMALALVWQRNLSDGEKRAVNANPWQMFEPERRPRSRVRPILSNAGVTEVEITTARPQLSVRF